MVDVVDQNPGGLPPDPVAPQPAISAPAPAAAAPLADVAVAETKPDPVVVVPAEPAKPALTTERPSLLESALTEGAKEPEKVEAKPAEAAKPGEKPVEAKPADAKPVEAKAPDPAVAEPAKPEPVEYKYDIPETLQMDDERRGSFHAALDKFRANPAEGVQDLLNMHADAMSAYAAQTATEQHRAFNSMRDGWNVDWKADPVIGGAGYDTALKTIARMRDKLVPSEMMEPTVQIGTDAAGKPLSISPFEQFLRVTGAGDHPVFARILHNAARFADEPQHDGLPQNPRPAPNNGRAPGARREILYDHPSSSRRT